MENSALQQLLNRAQWFEAFNKRTLDRGFDYARHGHVHLQQVDFNGEPPCIIDADVTGSGADLYECRVSIQQQNARVYVTSECSCPVGYDCKHAAATLWQTTWQADSGRTVTASRRPVIAAEGRAPGADDLAEWNRWLQGLSATHTQSDSAPGERRFGILLRTGDDDTLQANPAWLRPGKNKPDKLVDPKPVALTYRAGPEPAPTGGWPPDISAALQLLLQNKYAHDEGRGWLSIEHDWQEHALKALLAEYPVFYRKGDTPIERGPDRPAELTWQDLDDGSQRLTAAVSGDEAATLLRGASLWYVQPKSRRFGQIVGDEQLLAALHSAPTVEPEQVKAVRESLQQQSDAPAIPPPQPRPPVETVQARPEPVLIMRARTLPLKRRGRKPIEIEVGVARLVLNYAGHRIPPDMDNAPAGSVRRFVAGRVLNIVRDEAAEDAILGSVFNLNTFPAELLAHEQGIRRSNFEENDLLLQPEYHRNPAAPEAWKPLLAVLANQGFRIEYDKSFPHDQLVEIDDWHADIEPSGNAWFDVSLGIDVDGERIDLLPILRRVLADPTFPRHPSKGERKNAVHRVLIDENRSVEIPLTRLRALIEPLLEWIEGDDDLRLHRSQATALRELADDSGLLWRGGDALREQLELLADSDHSATEPRGFKATLRPYQREGLAWLDFLGKAGLGGILADDMGLGKTVQVLAHIVAARQRKQLKAPVLVVAPTSLVGNWRDEAARFAPRLKVLVIHGPDRADRYDDIADHHLIITTYPLLPRDREHLLEQRFSLLVLDEAQAIKNPRSQAARVVREIPAERRLAMTGTPLENHLGELWAQFDAVEPGLLGGHKQFTKLYRTPIERHGDSDRQQRLNRRVGALLLRRSKDQVLKDLPAKNEIVRTLELEGDQRSLYESLRLAQHERVRHAIKQRGLSQAGIIVLDALLKLRQACCDPRLVKLASAKKVRTSVKLDALLELVEGLVAEGRRILLFSQFTEMLGLIEAALKERKIEHQLLTGQTPGTQRAARVRRFQDGNIPVFLISLKAGGVGLNLTAADTVIHYDTWWNPAVEAQATDRAHRIGQDKPVFVYRLIASGTVEEKIQAMQARKADLAKALLEGGASQRLRFDEADLAALFAPL